jgi:hypothetical protein
MADAVLAVLALASAWMLAGAAGTHLRREYPWARGIPAVPAWAKTDTIVGRVRVTALITSLPGYRLAKVSGSGWSRPTRVAGWAW